MNIETVLANNDLREIAEADGAEFHKDTNGWRSTCPIHKGTDKTAFSIWLDDKWKWKCFSGKCGGGDVIDYIIARDRVDIKRAIEILGGGNPLTIEEVQTATTERRKRAEEWEAKKRAEYEQALQDLHQARAWERYAANLAGHNQLWRDRGVPDEYQGYWHLGYCPDFAYRHDEQLYHSPSLTIPIYNGEEMPANIRHRILKPVDPNDKYRPDRPGLRALPFMADYLESEHNKILVVEGEIKAMVTYICLNSPEWQVYGIPGKQSFRDLLGRTKDRPVWILFDPDAREQAEEAAKLVGGRMVQISVKIDDAINAGALDKNGLARILNTGRKI